MDIDNIIKCQEDFYKTGKTKDVDFRLESLIKLKKSIVEYEQQIFLALKTDLGKSQEESYMTEIGFVKDEISYIMRNLRKWSKPKKVRTSLAQMPGSSYIYSEPYGKVLIMSPWNYPFQLAIGPLIGAIVGGNCAIIKPSEYSTATSNIIKTIIEDTFDKDYISVIEGGREVNESILQREFDFIFFTGSPSVGRIVMESASRNLTPVILELGGKSPCIVHKDANILDAAKKVVWGKYLNSGQTCVAPDYLFIHDDIADEFISKSKGYINEFYTNEPLKCEDYPRIINEKHFKRLNKFLNRELIILGGQVDEELLKISPTFIGINSFDDEIMKEEIFGPILPIIRYKDIDTALNFINKNNKPLALYLFTSSKEIEKRVIQEVSFGGGCINDTIIHLATSFMPFGGVGNSGMGYYHGRYSFDAFTHKKSILRKSNIIDIPLRYPPYKGKLKFFKKLMG